MNFLELLLMSRKLSFEEGRIYLYGKGVLMLPMAPIANYFSAVNNDDTTVKNTYSMSKSAILSEYKENLSSSFKSSAGHAEFLRNNINLYGYGFAEFENSNFAIPGDVFIKDSPFVEALKGVVKKPIDHVLRGILAGVVTAATGQDTDAIELNCAAVSGEKCIMHLDTKAKLTAEFSELCRTQLP